MQSLNELLERISGVDDPLYGDFPTDGEIFIEADSNSALMFCVSPAWSRGFPITFSPGRTLLPEQRRKAP